MQKFKFDEVIDIVRVSSCKTCFTYTYTLPCPIEVDFDDYVKPITGKFPYPLTKIKTFQVHNDLVTIKSKVGRTWFEIKFKKDREQVKQLFDIQIAGYVEEKKQIKIEMQGNE